jgi:hypothetical protein
MESKPITNKHEKEDFMGTRNKIAAFSLGILLLTLAGVALAAESDEELAKKTQNPIASMISVPMQFNWDFDLGPDNNRSNFLLNVQPVIPISLNPQYNLIVRTIIPVKANEFPASVGGLGDIAQSFFFSPKKPLNGWIVGAGPFMLYPSATNETLGGRKWGAGPTAVLLKQQSGFTYGFLGNHLWSYAGSSDRDEVNATFLQPFLSFTMKSYTTFGVNTESTYDWKNSQWTVPINGTVTQLLKIGGQPLTVQLGYRYYAEAPTNGPSWGVRFAVTLLFPK